MCYSMLYTLHISIVPLLYLWSAISFIRLDRSHACSLAHTFVRSFICSFVRVCMFALNTRAPDIFWCVCVLFWNISKYANAVTLIFISTAQSSLQCGTHIHTYTHIQMRGARMRFPQHYYIMTIRFAVASAAAAAAVFIDSFNVLSVCLNFKRFTICMLK